MRCISNYELQSNLIIHYIPKTIAIIIKIVNNIAIQNPGVIFTFAPSQSVVYDLYALFHNCTDLPLQFRLYTMYTPLHVM